MIESYQIEIIRKRRAARLFWLIVFVCAFFLYYFFQGYYPDISLGMRRIFSESGSNTGSGASDLIRSFGIINVKTTPGDASIYLGSGVYNNNEKRMSDYGDYTMRIAESGYLMNTMDFRIDREKPFFIEKVSLLPKPTYRKLQKANEIYQITDDTYIIRTASGLTWSGATMTGRVNYSGSIEQIWGIYFSTATGTLRWATDKFMTAETYIQDYIKTCPHVEWQSELFYCPEVGSVLTEWHQYMTGIIDIENNLIARSGAILAISQGNIGQKWSQTGTIDLSKMILIEDTLYMSHSGILDPLNTKLEQISLPLDHITYAATLADDTIFIGDRDWATRLITRHTGDPLDRGRDIILPSQLSYRNIKLHTLSGNMVIETSKGILFIYRGSSDLNWLVEGEILSYSQNGVAYRKDGNIWWAEWSENR